MKVEVVSKDMSAKKLVQTLATQKYSLTHPMVKLQNKHLHVGKSCWGKWIKFKLATKAWAHKKNSFAGFPNHLLKNV